MKEPITEIQDIARRLAALDSSDDRLYDAVRRLDPGVARALKDANKEKALALRPVNLLRYEILRRVLNGEELDADATERIQAAIESRDASFFLEAGYPDEFAERLVRANIKNKAFQNWHVHFRVCYPFFYVDDDRRRVTELLETVVAEVKRELELDSHDHTCFSFDGPNNFGTTTCWIAIYPRERGSHTNAFQLFLKINQEYLEHGIYAGKNVQKKGSLKLSRGSRIEDAIDHLRKNRDRYLTLNREMIAIWKFAPGPSADHWEEFHQEGIISISFEKIVGDLRQYATSAELAARLGVEDPSNSNVVWNLESFRDAAVGDIVVANRGQRVVVGVGVIEGPYEYHADRDEYWHVRKTRWLVSTELKFDKPMFRLDTFSPTLKWQEIERRLLEEHPGLGEELEQIENRGSGPFGRVPTGSLLGLRTALSRAIRREWVRSIAGLLPVVDAALKAAGGPVDVEVSADETAAIASTSQQGLRRSCEAALSKVGGNHPVTPHVRTILQLTAGTSPTVYTREQAQNDSGLDKSTFEEHWAVLQDKRQVVLQGPPGTGKTYLAEIYGRLLVAGDMQRQEVVQFHPSYSYEDFVEGYRPTTDGGLEVREGIFKLICGKARESSNPAVLIIDEINRGDLSKIFGELLYLLEYRGKQIKLTHNPKLPFEIPENLYLIGTMNTADRSLALIDYALRRRFSFISLEPQYDLVGRLITSDTVDIDRLIGNYTQLNREISANSALGPDFQIGHSYLLRHHELTVAKLLQVWRFDIEPLLREYYFDAQEQLPILHELFFDGLAVA